MKGTEMDRTNREYQGLADAIILLAEALRDGKHIAPKAAAALLRQNAETLEAWTDDPAQA